MKVLFRILIIATCIGIIVYYTNGESSQTELLEGPPSITKPVVELEPSIPTEQFLPRPVTGISTLIGKTSKDVLKPIVSRSESIRRNMGMNGGFMIRIMDC